MFRANCEQLYHFNHKKTTTSFWTTSRTPDHCTYNVSSPLELGKAHSCINRRYYLHVHVTSNHTSFSLCHFRLTVYLCVYHTVITTPHTYYTFTCFTSTISPLLLPHSRPTDYTQKSTRHYKCHHFSLL